MIDGNQGSPSTIQFTIINTTKVCQRILIENFSLRIDFTSKLLNAYEQMQYLLIAT